MEYLNISRINEQHFDDIILELGGARVSEDDSRETQLNCDYKFDGALIELKLIEENPAEKITKQEKISDLFGSETKTIVIDPSLLNEDERRKYYNIIETPIKTALKKASKQLKKTSEFIECDTKVAVIINNGLSYMMPDEFEEVAVRRAKNDTSGIDILIVGGIYYLSDKIDGFVRLDFKEFTIRKENNNLVKKIRDGWYGFIESFMTQNILSLDLKRNKEPLHDMFFNRNGIRYVKPCPQFETKSNFWPSGERPREDSTGLKNCPPLATTLPFFDFKSYQIAKERITDSWIFKDSFSDYQVWVEEEIAKSNNIRQPLVPIKISKVDISYGIFSDLSEIASKTFRDQVKKIIDNATEYSDSHQSLDYILLRCAEIGIDKANDLSWISHERELPGVERSTPILEGERIKFEYALAIAATYCIQRDANCVYFYKDETYKWK